MRQFLSFILTLVTLIFASCGRTAPHFQFADQQQITYTDAHPMNDNEALGKLVLGQSSKASFIQTVTSPESNFDPKWLELSSPMGIFQSGNTRFEYHLGLIVYRDGKKLHIWRNEFSSKLGEALLRHDDSWKTMLEK